MGEFLLSFSLATYIGWRYSNHQQSTSFVAFINRFSSIGIALGVAALITVSSVMNGLEGQLKQRILGILPHLVVEHSVDIDAPPLANLVSAQMPFIEQEAIVQSPAQIKGIYIQGVEPSTMQTQSVVTEGMLTGSWQALQMNSFNVIISHQLARQLKVRQGDTLRLISTQASSVSLLGTIPSQRLVSVAGIFDLQSEMDDKVLFMHVADLAKLSRAPLTELQNNRLFLHDAFNYDQVLAALSPDKQLISDGRQRQGALFDAVKMEKNMMSLMLILIIAVAAFNIVAGLVMVVSEKSADIAILLTQGMSTYNVMLIFVLNGSINAAKGLFFGCLLGALIIWQLNPLLALLDTGLAFGPNGESLPIEVQTWQIVSILIASFLLAVVASIYPAKKAASILPAHSLRHE